MGLPWGLLKAKRAQITSKGSFWGGHPDEISEPKQLFICSSVFKSSCMYQDHWIFKCNFSIAVVQNEKKEKKTNTHQPNMTGWLSVFFSPYLMHDAAL